MNPRIPNIANIEAFLKYIPYFQDTDNEFFEVISKPQQMPYVTYSRKVDCLFQDLYHRNMIQKFAWTQWTKEAKKYFNNPELLATVDITIIQKLFTSIIRGDRFCEGILADMIDNGFILALLMRLKDIRVEIEDRFQGALLGLAVGDAMGVPLEFTDPGTFEPVNDMVGGGTFNLKPGMWTDDTSMALCLAESLSVTGKFDPADQLSRYLQWYNEGYLSVNGRCFDIGNTTSQALMTFQETGDPYPGPDHERSAGNGSLMRLAPIPLFFMSEPLKALEISARSSRTTHNHPLAVDACRYMGGLIHGALIGKSKKEILSPQYSPVPGYWEENPLLGEIEEVACGSFKKKEPPEIRGRGFVVKSLEAALWAFYKSETFEEGCLLAVNLGEDADTTGAIYGQLAGAYYGKNGIPSKWIKSLIKIDLIESITDRLYQTR